MPRAIRRWALARPYEWGLIFGTPVPGYEAPEDTVVPYARTAAAMVRPVVEAEQAGRLSSAHDTAAVSAELAEAVAPVTEGLFPGTPPEIVVSAVEAWTTMIGAVSLEVFGHWRNTILDPDLYFERTIADLADSVGLEPARRDWLSAAGPVANPPGPELLGGTSVLGGTVPEQWRLLGQLLAGASSPTCRTAGLLGSVQARHRATTWRSTHCHCERRASWRRQVPPPRREEARPIGAPDRSSRSAQDGQLHFDPVVGQEGQLVFEGVLPIDHVLVELRAVAFLARVLELVERHVFGVQEAPVLQKEVVVDRLMHVVLLPPARPLRAGADNLLRVTFYSPREPGQKPPNWVEIVSQLQHCEHRSSSADGEKSFCVGRGRPAQQQRDQAR